MKKAYGRRRVVTPLGERRHSKMSGERAVSWSAHTLKIRPTLRTLKSHKNTSAEFLYYPNSMCPIHEARHSIYRREWVREQDRGVGVSLVRSLLEGRSKKP